MQKDRPKIAQSIVAGGGGAGGIPPVIKSLVETGT